MGAVSLFVILSVLRFDFGCHEKGYTHVAKADPYNPKTGYGFEPGSGKTFFFSVRVPEGNYKVTVVLGDRHEPSLTTVKAELRRLMVERVQTKPGQFATRTFIVNVRTPQIPGDSTVRLKERERTSETWAWDDKLTLEFSNREPKLCSLRMEKVNVPAIYIAGDSTSTDQAREPYNSWGQMLPRFFKPVIAVANNGESGESLHSFIAENRLAKVMSSIKPGDYLFVQFGHNDQKEKGPGIGAFTSYKTDLERVVRETWGHGATPVLITPVNRRTFGPDGKIVNSLGDYPAAVRQVAREQGVALIDLNAMSKVLYEAFGPEKSGILFADHDHTHHSDYGSYELAKCIVRGIREDHLPIAKDLVSDVPPFDPAHPDAYKQFDIPPDPQSTAVKPYGN